MEEERGSIAFFSTYRPAVPLDIYSCPISPWEEYNEVRMTDGKSCNYNSREIPPEALKAIRNTVMGDIASLYEVDNGYVTGLVFVSERTNNLETLHFALRFKNEPRRMKVFNFGELYNTGYNMGVRMEDSGCFAGNRYFIFISTYESNENRRQPWTAFYRTDLKNGETILSYSKSFV